MNRTGLLLVLIGFLIVGCSQPEAVKDKDTSSGEQSSLNYDNDRSNAGREAAILRDQASARGSGERAAADADVVETETETAVAETKTPAELLRELMGRSASNAEIFEFVEKHPSTDEAFEALQSIAEQRVSGEPRTQLMRLLDEQFVKNEAVEEQRALQAAMLVLAMSEPEARQEQIDAMGKRFVTGRESLDDIAMTALSGLLPMTSSASLDQLLTGLVDRFADDQNVLRLAQQLERGVPKPEVENFLKGLSEKSTEDKVKGLAMISLAKYYTALPDFKSYVDDDRFAKQFPDSVDYIRDFEPAEYAEEIESLLNQVSEDFADVDVGRGKTLGELAAGELFVINHLSVGKEAPDIVGEDLDGEMFKLSEYRGKIVMLDFWGDW